MLEIILEHRINRSTKTHILWKHYAGMPTNLVGERVVLTEKQFSVCEDYFNSANTKLRNRLREMESNIETLECEKKALIRLVQLLGEANLNLQEKINALSVGDNAINDLMTFHSFH